MGHFLGVVRAVVIVGLCATCYAGGNPEDALIPPPKIPVKSRIPASQASEFTGKADWVYEASDWTLNLYIIHKGTRSQGSHGVLFFEGKEVKGNPREIRALPIGTVQYNGPAEARAHLWDDSGWQMKDPLVKPVINTQPDLRSGRKPDIKALEKDINSTLSE